MLQTSNKTTATLTLDTLLTEETLRLSVTLQISLKFTYPKCFSHLDQGKTGMFLPTQG